MISQIQQNPNSKFPNLSLQSQIEQFQSDKKSPNSNKDLRRLVLDKVKNSDSPIRNTQNKDEINQIVNQNYFQFDIQWPLKTQTPSNIQIRNEQYQQLIKEILHTKEAISLENTIHNDVIKMKIKICQNIFYNLYSKVLLHLMKKTIRNKEEKAFIQHFLKYLNLFQMDQDMTKPGDNDLSQKIYPYVSYSFFNKGETIYNSVLFKYYLQTQLGEYSFNYYVVLKGKVAQYNDTDHQSPHTIKKCYNEATKLNQQRVSHLMNIPTQLFSNKINRKLHEEQQNRQQQQAGLEEEIYIPDKIIEKYYTQGKSFGEIEIMTNQTRFQEPSQQNFQKIQEFEKLFGNFTESQFFFQQIRSSTMICVEDTHLLTISKEGLDQVLIRYKGYQIKEKLAFFKQYSFFSNIPDSRILNHINSGKKLTFNNKQVIFQEGDLVDSIYFIQNGEVSLSSLYNKRRINLQILGQNNFFGFDEIANYSLPLNKREIKAVSSSNDLVLVAFNIQKFMKFLLNYKQFESFLGDCRARIQIRKQIEENIVNTQNIFTENDQAAKKMIEYEDEIKKNLQQQWRAPQLQQQEQQNSLSLEQSKQLHLNRISKLEQIISAREQNYKTLDRQQKIQSYKNNKKYGSVDINQLSPNNDSFSLNQKQVTAIFEQKKDFIFDQSYFQDQEQKIGKNNKSMLELKQLINNCTSESNAKRKLNSSIASSLQNITYRLIPDINSTENNSISLKTTQNKFLKNFLQKKKLQVKFQDFEKTQQNQQLLKRLPSCEEQLNNQKETSKITEKLPTQSNLTELNKLSKNGRSQTLMNKSEFLKNQYIKAKTNSISKFFEQSPLEKCLKQEINNMQIISLPSPYVSNKQVDIQREKEDSPFSLESGKLNNEDFTGQSNLGSLSYNLQKEFKFDEIKKINMDRNQQKTQSNFQLINRRPRIEKQQIQLNFSHFGYQSDYQNNDSLSSIVSKKQCKSSQHIQLPDIKDQSSKFQKTFF